MLINCNFLLVISFSYTRFKNQPPLLHIYPLAANKQGEQSYTPVYKERGGMVWGVWVCVINSNEL